MKTKLDKDELALLRSFESGEWQKARDFPEEKIRYQRYARSTLKKDHRVNIRISEKDLYEIQKKAMQEGIPYQTLMASVLHKFVSGRLAVRHTI